MWSLLSWCLCCVPALSLEGKQNKWDIFYIYLCWRRFAEVRNKTLWICLRNAASIQQPLYSDTSALKQSYNFKYVTRCFYLILFLTRARERTTTYFESLKALGLKHRGSMSLTLFLWSKHDKVKTACCPNTKHQLISWQHIWNFALLHMILHTGDCDIQYIHQPISRGLMDSLN